MYEHYFNSRYIVKNDISYAYIYLDTNRLFNFAELQKPQEASWHSRPYEYCFVAMNMLDAFMFKLIGFDTILDLACGAIHPGYMAIANIERVGKIYSLDLNPALLTNGMDHPKVEKVIADAAATGFGDNYFDAIACVSALEHIANYLDVMKEMHRILKPGGMAFVTLDISTDVEKTRRHNVDGKTPDDYRDAFEDNGLHIFGTYDSIMQIDAVDTVCSKYPLVKDESQFKPGQHRALKAFKMVLRKQEEAR